jgi:FixJ family two-component response regulator
MTDSARRYFELYYKVQRAIDEQEGEYKINKLRKEMERCYNQMTEKEYQLLDVVGVEHGKYE